MNAKIPENFVKVVKKMIPEISDIQIETLDVIQDNVSWSTMEQDDTENFRVSVRIVIPAEYSLIQSREEYTKVINNLFNYTYPDILFIRFYVVGIEHLKKPSRRKILIDLFSLEV